MVISNKPKKPVKKKLNDAKVDAIVEELFENVRKGYQSSQNSVNILSNDNYDGLKVDESLFSYENINRLCSGLPYPLSDEQYEIAKKIIKWIREECSMTLQYGKSAPFKRLSGYAGSGKSCIISWLITEGFNYFPESIKMKSIAVCSFTWKAALVLQSRGIKDACSIHSIFYEIQGADDGKPYFSKRTREEVHSAYSLIIVDEASMVGKFMREDIEYFGVPVLYVGDAGQ